VPRGGDPVLFQHVFWFFGHPEVYIMILPAFGAVSSIIPTFSRKPLFGYTSMVYATASIAFLSFIVWAHHMFVVGIPLVGELFFMYATLLIAVPTGVKVFNWVSTMWQGSLTFETPMLFAVAFVILFTIGGFSGLMLAIAPADFQYHDTYFVVAHFHYVLVPGAIFGIFASAYYWLPKWTGHMYDETLGKLHFWLSFVGMNMAFFPMHFVGLAGMPRRVPDYNLQFADFNMVSSIGAFMFGATQIFFLFIVIKCIRGGRQHRPSRGTALKAWSGACPRPRRTTPSPRHRRSNEPASTNPLPHCRVIAMADSVPLKRLVTRLLILVLAMFAFGFALVPIYDVMCKAFGINGKTAGQYEGEQIVDPSRQVRVQFLSTNAIDMVWEFHSKADEIVVNPGAVNEMLFVAYNPSDKPMTAQAIPSISPAEAAMYFHKTECFCFTQQVLQPGERIEMPVRFIVDRDMPKDVKHLTLAYTLFDITARQPPVAVHSGG